MPEEVKSKRQRTEDPAVTKFREYLRIKTVHPEPDYGIHRQIVVLKTASCCKLQNLTSYVMHTDTSCIHAQETFKIHFQ